MGFKQSEIGIIPDDWILLSYGRVFEFLKTATYSKAELSDNQEIYYVHYGDIHTKWDYFLDFDRNSLPTISKKQAKNYHLIRDGDIIIADASEDYDGICKTVEVRNIKSRKAISGLHTFLLRDKNNVLVSGYRGYIYKNKLVKNQFDRLATGLKVFGVSKNNLKTVLIPLPATKSEQVAIVNALSDTDELIENIERLILKRRYIKQGVIQELLSGRRRLNGFNSGWKEIKLGEIGKTYGGLSGKSKIDFEEGACPYIPFLNILNNPIINCNYFDYVKIRPNEKQNKAHKGDLFFNGSSETPEEVGMCSVLLDDIPELYLNSFCFGFRLYNQKETNGLFLSYYFRSFQGRKLIFSLAQGATRYNLSKTNFLQLILKIPEIEEQTAIANVIYNMDKEIAVLEQTLLKYQMIKQGMMQTLLTGKIRLV